MEAQHPQHQAPLREKHALDFAGHEVGSWRGGRPEGIQPMRRSPPTHEDSAKKITVPANQSQQLGGQPDLLETGRA